MTKVEEVYNNLKENFIKIWEDIYNSTEEIERRKAFSSFHEKLQYYINWQGTWRECCLLSNLIPKDLKKDEEDFLCDLVTSFKFTMFK